ncbi:MAG: hypothetical protein LAT84_14720 [Balneolia bacterium]|nr:hypothetical protein [Balneolia bacterium]
MKQGSSGKKTIREKISSRIMQSDMPIIVYAVMFLTMFLLWRYQEHGELAMEFFVELGGAAFTLFIIDFLLVRSKTKRFKVVRDELNYLIARNVNRIRDGVASRIFNFNPEVDASLQGEAHVEETRRQRTEFLNTIAGQQPDAVIAQIQEAELFTDQSYDYFNEKAGEIWDILNIKYSDYFHPELASHLINLNINLRDLCGHIRQYQKSRRFPNQAETYKNIGRMGASVSIIRIITALNYLKEEGYSDTAALSLVENYATN